MQPKTSVLLCPTLVVQAPYASSPYPMTSHSVFPVIRSLNRGDSPKQSLFIALCQRDSPSAILILDMESPPRPSLLVTL